MRASKDLQLYGREFVALSEAIGEILQNIVEKVSESILRVDLKTVDLFVSV